MSGDASEDWRRCIFTDHLNVVKGRSGGGSCCQRLEVGAAELFPFAGILWFLTPGTDVKIYVRGGFDLAEGQI